MLLSGFLTVDDVVENVKPLFYTRMRMGEFDPPEMNPYNKITMSVVMSPEHRKLAIKSAQKSFVLLKNKDKILPLKYLYDKVAVSMLMCENVHSLKMSFLKSQWYQNDNLQG